MYIYLCTNFCVDRQGHKNYSKKYYMKLKFLSSVVLVLVAVTAAFSQQAPSTYSIKGTVIDSINQKPLAYVTIKLSFADTLAGKTTISKNDGSFIFEKIPAKNYKLTCTDIGYISKSIVVNLKDSASRILDVGRIVLTARTNQLKAVVVNTNSPLIKQETDRLIYNIQADPESKVNNVLAMLHKVPFLSVDANDNVLLNGNSDYKILINGKTSGLAGNLKEILRSMPASTLQRIEVMTNPSAKYDAEGAGGIINLITAKNLSNDYNGTININEQFPVGGPGIGGSFIIKQGKFGMSVNGGAGLYNVPKTRNMSYRSTGGDDITDLVLDEIRKTDNKNGYLVSTLSYEINSLNLVSAQFNINGAKINSTNTQSSVLNDENGIMQAYNLSGKNVANAILID